ncbi:MAG TPA: M56 family metallopeptidase [Chitinophagaceae bacterium]|jgi:bla regulator protein blaR1|nr:M56 family metallopeptidase [Chitinophagaceae bacterium]
MFSFVIPTAVGTNFLQALGWAVLNSLWQMAFLWVMFQVILSFGINKPAAKSRLATILLSTGFVWFMYTLIFHWFIDPESIKRSLLAIGSFETGNTVWNEKLQWILPYASAAYLLMLILPTIQFIRNYKFVQVIRTAGLSKCNVDLRIFVQRFAERMGIHKPVHIYISDLISSPVTIGFLKPIILMPIAAINNLTVKQVEAVLLHELAHIRRHDYFINLLINFILTILYFNPFVKLFAKTIEREREKSCDEIVMQFQYDPHGYASALLVLEKNNFMRQRMAVAASGQRNDLLHRIEKILGIEKRKTPDFKKLGGLLAGLVCIIGLNAIFFFSSPVIQNNPLAFSAFTNPFYQLVSDGREFTIEKPVERQKAESQIAAVKKVSTNHSNPSNKKIEHYKEVNIPVPEQRFVLRTAERAGDFALVDQRMQLEPKLKKYQEEQVKGTVEATKKILEEGQWKQVEKNVADALTQNEKECLKQKYYVDLAKVNWQKLEDKLRLSYNNINWDKVNAQLNTAITTIKLDSLTEVYNIALDDLNKAEDWMTQNKAVSIPDTDLQLNEIKVQKEQVQQQLQTIKAIKERKIIHL